MVLYLLVLNEALPPGQRQKRVIDSKGIAAEKKTLKLVNRHLGTIS